MEAGSGNLQPEVEFNEYSSSKNYSSNFRGALIIWFQWQHKFNHGQTYDLVLWPFDLLIPKPNQFIFIPRCTIDKSLVENRSMHSLNIAETTISRTHAWTDIKA